MILPPSRVLGGYLCGWAGPSALHRGEPPPQRFEPALQLRHPGPGTDNPETLRSRVACRQSWSLPGRLRLAAHPPKIKILSLGLESSAGDRPFGPGGWSGESATVLGAEEPKTALSNRLAEPAPGIPGDLRTHTPYAGCPSESQP